MSMRRATGHSSLVRYPVGSDLTADTVPIGIGYGNSKPYRPRTGRQWLGDK
jgi:hypothetical protein